MQTRVYKVLCIEEYILECGGQVPIGDAASCSRGAPRGFLKRGIAGPSGILTAVIRSYVSREEPAIPPKLCIDGRLAKRCECHGGCNGIENGGNSRFRIPCLP